MSTEFINDQWRLPNAWNGTESNVNKQSNYSLSFSGSNQYIDLGNSTEVQPVKEMSISAWINASSLATYRGIVSCMYNGSSYDGFALRLDDTSSNKIQFVVSPSFTQIKSTSTITTGQWYHLVATYDGANIKLYFNGSLESSTSLTGNIDYSDGSRNTIIGSLYPNAVEFTGKIDGISIYNYALTDGTGGTVNQIAALYGSSSTGIGNPMSLSPKPVFYAPLGDQDAFNGANYLVPNSSLKDYVFDFTVNNQVISFGNDTSLKPSSNYTFSIWFKATSASYALFDTNSSTSSGVNALFTGTNITYYHRTTGGTVTTIFGGFILDDWQNFTVTWSASTGILRGFVNGKYSNQALNSVSDIVWGNDLRVGAYSNNFFYKGEQSNFVMWNDTLTDGFSGTPTAGDVAGGQVAEVYNNGSPQTTITGTPVGWWKLDATATYDLSTTTWSIPDDSTNSNTGTSSGMTQANLVQSDLSFTSGYSPYALDFDGGSSTIIETGSILPTSNNFSISFWVNMDNVATSGETLVDNRDSGSTGWGIYVVSNTLYFKLKSNATTTYDITGESGNWLHIVGTYDGSTAKLYVNNATSSFQSITETFNITSNFSIGRRSWATGATLNGKLSNCSVWNAALTSAQVTEIFNSGRPSNLNNHSAYSNLTNWWQLGSNSSFNTNWTVLDEKGSNNGTSVNMTEADIVDGVGSYANGLSSGMGGDEVIGDAPYSSSNSLSVNMDVLDRVTDTPS